MTSPKDDLEELKPDVGDGGALTSPDEERAEDVSVVALVDESAMQAMSCGIGPFGLGRLP